MRVTGRMSLAVALSLVAAPLAAAKTPQDQSVALAIRRDAGLPPESATGQIMIVDVGHYPLDPMLSIVANKTEKGWSVSYACSSSPRCASTQDHRVASYVLGTELGVEVDAILKILQTGKEPDGQLPSPAIIAGRLDVTIDYEGFRRSYRRVGTWGKTLGRLESRLTAPLADDSSGH